MKATNVRDGVLAAGIHFRGADATLMEARFTATGEFEPSCMTAAVTGASPVAKGMVYGSAAVTDCLAAYKTAETVAGEAPQEYLGGVAAQTVKCFVGNSPSNLEMTTVGVVAGA